MIRDADGALKDRLGRAAYVLTGARGLRTKPFKARIAIDGDVVVPRQGQLHPRRQRRAPVRRRRGLRARPSPTTAGSTSASSPQTALMQWSRTLARTAAGHPERSPFVRVTSGRKFDVKLDRKVLYELDGGDRVKAKRLKVRVEPKAVTVCVPSAA